MAVTSGNLELGTKAPDFALPSTEGGVVALADFADAPALLVMFLCNHCPYVRHVQEGLAGLVAEYQERGVAAVGICSNDAERYPDDGRDGLARQKAEVGFTFPYLLDESQEVARGYGAACTPEFYVFDATAALAYHGQMDASRPGGREPVTGRDLRAALDAVLAGDRPSGDQRQSIGCGIKWKPGNEPR